MTKPKPKLNFFDRALGAVAPAFALNRVRSRVLLDHATRAYEGASKKDGWNVKRRGASANANLMADGPELRFRARAQYENVPYVKSAVDAKVATHIGEGIFPRVPDEQPQQAKIEALLKRFFKECDADGRLEFAALTSLIERTAVIDGECLIRRRRRRLEDGLALPVQVQVLEIDWLDESRQGVAGPNTTINGIEYDVIGRPAAYWLYSQHPGEMVNLLQVRGSVRVPAESIIHYYTPKRPGQGRGVSDLHSVIARVRDVSVYEDAERARKNLESRLGVIGSQRLDSSEAPPPPTTEENSQADKNATGIVGSLSGGSIIQGAPGMDYTTITPSAPPGYVDTMKWEAHLIASGLGVTYEQMTGDGSQNNFSNTRVKIIELRRAASAHQWNHVVPMLEKIIAWAIEAGRESGVIPQALPVNLEWSVPKWDYVDPKTDIEAEAAAIANGLDSWPEALRRRNYEPKKFIADWSAFAKQMEASGMLETMLALQGYKQGNPAPAAPAAAPKRSDDAEAMHHRLAGIESTMRDVANRSQQPTIHLHTAPVDVTVEPARVEVHNELPTQQIVVQTPAPEVRVHVNPTPIEVRAEAPIVNITNEVTAQAGETQVIVNSPVKSVATHERDDATGEILRTVTEHKNK
jgi:lambda family phage portal protein